MAFQATAFAPSATSLNHCITGHEIWAPLSHLKEDLSKTCPGLILVALSIHLLSFGSSVAPDPLILTEDFPCLRLEGIRSEGVGQTEAKHQRQAAEQPVHLKRERRTDERWDRGGMGGAKTCEREEGKE